MSYQMRTSILLMIIILIFSLCGCYQMIKEDYSGREVDDTLYEYIPGDTYFVIEYTSTGTTSDPPITIITTLDEYGLLKQQETSVIEDGEIIIINERSYQLTTEQVMEIMDELLNRRDYFAMKLEIDNDMEVMDGSTDCIIVKYNDIEKAFGGYAITWNDEFNEVVEPFSFAVNKYLYGIEEIK